MGHLYFLVDNIHDMDFLGENDLIPRSQIMLGKDYLVRPVPLPKKARLVNLCRDYSYLSLGYYCSLLAEARNQRMVPSAEAMLSIGWKRIYGRALSGLNEQLFKITKRLADTDDLPRDFLICFGKCEDARFDALARSVFDAFRCPILRIKLAGPEKTGNGWEIHDVTPLSIRKLGAGEQGLFQQGLRRFVNRYEKPTPTRMPPKYTLAILHDPKEVMPPSSPKTLLKFQKIAGAMGVRIDLITRRDFARIAEFDALFIRETTALDHHTYRFARKAEAEGMPVIDDPTSIIRCTNKVYMAEMFRLHAVPSPQTIIVDKHGLDAVLDKISLPIVLKIPDGAFSRGVKKATTKEAFLQIARDMLKESDLILAQEYMETLFDWRIGVLNGFPLFASKYFMAKGHWQIVKHEADGRYDEGRFETLPVEQAPSQIIDAALAAAALAGRGLYGVDIKETPRGPMVVEVNDNPNIDAGIEDKILKDELYRVILRDFIRRIEAR